MTNQNEFKGALNIIDAKAAAAFKAMRDQMLKEITETTQQTEMKDD